MVPIVLEVLADVVLPLLTACPWQLTTRLRLTCRRPRHPYYNQLAGLTGQALPPTPREDEQLTSCPDDRLLLTTGWPWEGRIELRDEVTMRYRPDTDLVLKGVTLTIK